VKPYDTKICAALDNKSFGMDSVVVAVFLEGNVLVVLEYNIFILDVRLTLKT
jgi:hypothetical protein